MSFSKGDIVLLPYPFTDLKSSKVRPAVVVASGAGIYSDIFVAPLTSRLTVLNAGEFALSDWISAGLNVPSALKRGCILIDTGLIKKKIGSLSDQDRFALDDALRLWLEL
jgi:mRNA interferase MazF